jgi:hypothetical protein
MNIKRKIYHFWKYLSEKQLRGHYEIHYKKELEEYNTYSYKKPNRIVKKEMKQLQKFWGCYPFQYIRYGMYKATCTMTMEDMKNYIPNYFAYYLFFPKFFKDYGIVSEDKELTYRVLESYKVSQPVLLLQFKNGIFYDSSKSIISKKEVEQIITSSDAKKMFLKPTHGLGGRGILIFTNKGHFIDEQNNYLTYDHIKDTLGLQEDYILQEGLQQHNELNLIYPNAVNTFRVMTHVVNGKTKIMYSMLRMGQGGSQIDNASQTGLVCKIDVQTGEFEKKIHIGHGKTIDRHPDSNFSFDNYVFPYWKEIYDFVTVTAQKMEFIPYVGWDIAYSENGPKVIEMNAGAGLEYLQDCHGGVREAYGIDNPKTYWSSSRFAIKDL